MTEFSEWTGPFCSENLSFRVLTVDDATAFQEMTDHPKVTEAISFLETPFDLLTAENFIKSAQADTDRIFGGWRRTDNRMVSCVGAHLKAEKRIEIGYWVGAVFQRLGYGYETASNVVSEITTRLPTYDIFAECLPENTASWHVLEKIGFRSTGKDGARAGRKLLSYAERA